MTEEQTGGTNLALTCCDLGRAISLPALQAGYSGIRGLHPLPEEATLHLTFISKYLLIEPWLLIQALPKKQ